MVIVITLVQLLKNVLDIITWNDELILPAFIAEIKKKCILPFLISHSIWVVTVPRAQHTEVPIMLPQVAYKGYVLHWVYQFIIETVWMWTIVCSVFGKNHVPCTLKTESETKSSPGFSIDIISGILSEWMLPFYTPNELFSQLYYMAGAICISTIWKHILWIFIALTHWNIWLVDMYEATLEHIILILSQTLKHIYTACFAEK